MTKNRFVAMVLQNIEKNFDGWDCPAGRAHKKWAKELLEGKNKKVKASERLFLLKYKLGALKFNVSNRDEFRNIAYRTLSFDPTDGLQKAS